MFLEFLVLLTLAAALAALAFAFLAWRRAGAPAQDSGLMKRLALLHAATDAHPKALRDETAGLRAEQDRQFTQLRRELTDGQAAAAEASARSGRELGDMQRERLDRMERAQKTGLDTVSAELKAVKEGAAAEQERSRAALAAQLESLRKENEAKLEQMRLTVDEKLQGTLEKRFTDSFQLVTERLDKVHQGLGEMQSLATGVGDLKRVLTDVRQRGAWGEVQLSGLLEDMLTPEQYERQAKVRKGSEERVDFAIRLPHDDGVLLPIDCKFPQEDYDRLLHAHTGGDPAAVEAAAKALEQAIRRQAKSIEDKYVNPPATTNFAIMYLPTEGLFAEVARRPGLAAELQQKHRVTVTGPTTLAAVLNSLRMGFTSLTIQKRSSEVWTVLGTVKSEFEKFDGIWEKVANQLKTASNTVEDARKKTGTITSKLKSVQSLEAPVAPTPLLELSGLPIADEAA